MRCKTHCPPRGGLSLGPLLAALGAFAALAVAVAVLRAAVPFLLPVAAVLAVLAVVAVPALRWSARLSVAYWRPPVRSHYGERITAIQARLAPAARQIKAPPLALEAAKVTVPVVQVTAEERIRR